MYKNFFKRIFDFIFSLSVFVVLLPILILIALLLLIVNKGNPFFIQERPGKDEKIFKVIKFRTMNNKCDKEGNLLPDMERLTTIGRFIRNTSLDEIPQLINIIKGDMSLIGPRPLFVKYLPLYSKEQARRHEIRPGITGWAQVNGRNTITNTEKFKYDVWYVDHISFKLDMKIFFMTITKIFKSEGVYTSENDTMPHFNGNN